MKVEAAATNPNRRHAPEHSSAGEQDADGASTHRPINFRQRDWALLLNDFSTRNAGRGATLEIEHATFGAQRAAAGYRLLGVVYDWRDERVEIMLGVPGSTEHHLTHTASGVVGLEVLRNTGRDAVLCIEQPESRTLLLLE